MEWTTEHKKIIFNSVRYYQMNRVPLNSKEYQICDDILKNLFDEVYTQQREQPT